MPVQLGPWVEDAAALADDEVGVRRRHIDVPGLDLLEVSCVSRLEAAGAMAGSSASSLGRWMTTSRRAPDSSNAWSASASLRCPRSAGSGPVRVASQRKTSASRASSTSLGLGPVSPEYASVLA